MGAKLIKVVYPITRLIFGKEEEERAISYCIPRGSKTCCASIYALDACYCSQQRCAFILTGTGNWAMPGSCGIKLN